MDARLGSQLTVTQVAAPFDWEPLGADGIVRCRFKAAVIITEEIARRTMAELATLASGRRIVLLADIRLVKSVSREARVFYDSATEFSALALLAGSPATQMIANFFIGLKRPKVPTQMFTDEEKALAWLRRHTA